MHTAGITREVVPPTGAALTDEELVQRVREGEVPLFEVIMRRHNQRLYRLVRSVIRDEDEVEDVMQQTYVAAYTCLGQFSGSARFSTWLLKIGLNEALARRRRRARLVVFERAMEDGDSMQTSPRSPVTPEENAAGRELVGLLEDAVDRLPELYRQVFVLRAVDGLGTTDVAGILGLAEDVVKQRLHRARNLLRRDLEARVGGAATSAFAFFAPRCDRVVAAVMARIR